MPNIGTSYSKFLRETCIQISVLTVIGCIPEKESPWKASEDNFLLISTVLMCAEGALLKGQ